MPWMFLESLVLSWGTLQPWTSNCYGWLLHWRQGRLSLLEFRFPWVHLPVTFSDLLLIDLYQHIASLQRCWHVNPGSFSDPIPSNGHLAASEHIHALCSQCVAQYSPDREGSAAVTKSSSQSADRWSKEARLCLQVWRRGRRFGEQSPFLSWTRLKVKPFQHIGHLAHFAGRVLRLVFR